MSPVLLAVHPVVEDVGSGRQEAEGDEREEREDDGVAIDVPVSGWLFLCALLLALFLALAKRRQELVSLEDGAVQHRPSLGEYSLPLIDQMLSTVAGMCILAYGLYTVAPDTVAKVGSDRLKWTLPFVLYGILRYLFLVHRRNVTGSPERVLLSDVPTLVNLLLYAAAVLAVLYVVPR